MSAEIMMIDNMPVEIEGEKNILAVIRKAGIDLPTFCYYSELSVYGACRMCVVEVEGQRGLVPSCAFPSAPGLKVKTHSARAVDVRRTLDTAVVAPLRMTTKSDSAEYHDDEP